MAIWKPLTMTLAQLRRNARDLPDVLRAFVPPTPVLCTTDEATLGNLTTQKWTIVLDEVDEPEPRLKICKVNHRKGSMKGAVQGLVWGEVAAQTVSVQDGSAVQQLNLKTSACFWSSAY